MAKTFVIRFCLFVSSCTFLFFSAPVAHASEGSQCEVGFVSTGIGAIGTFKPIEKTSERKDSPEKQARREALAVASRFKDYFEIVKKTVLERDGIVDIAKIALLAEEHMLLMGPPGNAKSQLTDVILGNIVSDATGATSYYRIQMTPETTMSETHGPMDFKKLQETGVQERIYSEGMLKSRNVFIDEIFDARANAQRNILGMLAERAHAQGPNVVKGDIETAIAASNKYLSEVYERAGDDGPKALLDRFSYIVFVPATFESVDSYVSLIQGVKKGKPAFPRLTFEDLEKLRALTKQVKIPNAVAKAIALLSARMKGETEALEAASAKTVNDKKKNGEEPPVPYKATKYHSPRTIYKASAALQAIIVKDWIELGGKRKLEATIDDLRKLEVFFTLNGPKDTFLEAELKRSSNPHERSQLSTIRLEREIFQRTLDGIIEEMDAVAVRYALTDLSIAVSGAKSPAEKEAAAKSVISALATLVSDKRDGISMSEVDGKDVGRDFVESYLEGLLRGLVSEKEFTTFRQTVYAEIQNRKAESVRREKDRLEKIAEDERVRVREENRKLQAERLAREAAEARSKQIAMTFSDPASVKVEVVQVSFDPRRKEVELVHHRERNEIMVYNKASNMLNVFEVDQIGSGRMRYRDVPVLSGDRIPNTFVTRISETRGGLILEPNSGTAFYRYDFTSKSVEVVPVSIQKSLILADSNKGDVTVIDPSTLKAKVFKADGSSAPSGDFKFIDGQTNGQNKTVADFKSTLTSYEFHRAWSKDGKYLVLIGDQVSEAYTVDFEKRTIEPLRTTDTKVSRNREYHSRMSLSREPEFVIVDVTGERPMVRKFDAAILASQGTENFETIPGTNLVLIPGKKNQGNTLYDGTTATKLADDVFGVFDGTPFGIDLVGDVFVTPLHDGSRWSLKFVRRMEKAATAPSNNGSEK